MEYFCSEGDALRRMRDDELIGFASGELERIGLVGKPEILDATVIRVPKAYPSTMEPTGGDWQWCETFSRRSRIYSWWEETGSTDTTTKITR
jgi:hypothetical protein